MKELFDVYRDRRGGNVRVRIGTTLLTASLLLVIVGCGGGAEEGDSEVAEELDELVLGFTPSVEEGVLTERAEPLADAVSDELGVPVQADIVTNYIGLVEAMGNEQVDIGRLNAFGYVLLKDRYPESDVLLKAIEEGSEFYRGQFVVGEESGIESLEDLEGREVALVDPASTSGYLFPMYHLIQEGVVEEGSDPEEFFGNAIYAGSHDNALAALYNGEVEAAVSYEFAEDLLEDEYPDFTETTEILEYTDEIPTGGISVRPGLTDEQTQEIEDAFMASTETEEYQQLFQDLYDWEDLVEAEDSDYDIIREAAAALDLELEELAE